MRNISKKNSSKTAYVYHEYVQQAGSYPINYLVRASAHNMEQTFTHTRASACAGRTCGPHNSSRTCSVCHKVRGRHTHTRTHAERAQCCAATCAAGETETFCESRCELFCVSRAPGRGGRRPARCACVSACVFCVRHAGTDMLCSRLPECRERITISVLIQRKRVSLHTLSALACTIYYKCTSTDSGTQTPDDPSSPFVSRANAHTFVRNIAAQKTKPQLLHPLVEDMALARPSPVVSEWRRVGGWAVGRLAAVVETQTAGALSSLLIATAPLDPQASARAHQNSITKDNI